MGRTIVSLRYGRRGSFTEPHAVCKIHNSHTVTDRCVFISRSKNTTSIIRRDEGEFLRARNPRTSASGCSLGHSRYLGLAVVCRVNVVVTGLNTLRYFSSRRPQLYRAIRARTTSFQAPRHTILEL